VAGVTATPVLEQVHPEVGLDGMRIGHHHRHHHRFLRILWMCFLRSFWGVNATWNRCSAIWKRPCATYRDNTRRGDNQGGHEVNQYSSFKDFMDTKPPVFKEALEPLEADE